MTIKFLESFTDRLDLRCVGLPGETMQRGTRLSIHSFPSLPPLRLQLGRQHDERINILFRTFGRYSSFRQSGRRQHASRGIGGRGSMVEHTFLRNQYVLSEFSYITGNIPRNTAAGGRDLRGCTWREVCVKTRIIYTQIKVTSSSTFPLLFETPSVSTFTSVSISNFFSQSSVF